MANVADIEISNSDSGYERISRALLFLAANFRRQPTLEQGAEIAGLSLWHFQREFTRLAGVSPKAFIAHLTLERAKHALAQGYPVLDASLEVGLSGPSRLHDLTLKIEAMTPGAYAKRGAGLTIAYGWHGSLFGRALPVRLLGTPWQINVWKALLAIPPGSVTAYGALAETLCSRRAARATASAIARNPIAVLIPCHRVITATGALGGYRWGEVRKRALLALEASRVG
jgi:AraC family transcriptional regulator of adaptative response/methylated-DNA-[protein]-cysteine methyltransferase